MLTRLIRRHPDSQISENSVLFLLRIAVVRDIAWAENKIFKWKNLYQIIHLRRILCRLSTTG
jgi:hypothetical protein